MKKLLQKKTLRHNDQINEALFPSLIFNISIIGNLSKPVDNIKILDSIKTFLGGLKDSFSPFARQIYGYRDSSEELQVLLTSCVDYTKIHSVVPKDTPFFLISPSPEITSAWLGPNNTAANLVEFDYCQTVTQNDAPDYIDWVVEQSDLIIAFWDGKKDSTENNIWNYVVNAADKNVPIIWMNPDEEDHWNWCVDSFSSPYNQNQVQEYINNLFGEKNPGQKKELQELIHPKINHLPFWSKIYSQYIRGFRIKNGTQCSDILIDTECGLPKPLNSYHMKFEVIKFFFHQSDKNAIFINNVYRSALLLRAVLPFAATIALAIGFYASIIGGYLLPNQAITYNNGWVVFVIAGFLLQAFINLFIQWFSDQNNRRGWHKDFIDQRYMAESLRIAAHFLPLNIPLNSQQCSAIMSPSSKQFTMIRRLRSILRCGEINPIVYKTTDCVNAFSPQVKSLLENQIQYHKSIAQKYRIIAKRVEKSAWIFFWIGFVIVIARAIFQASEPVLHVTQWIINNILEPHSNLAPEIHKKFIETIFNMLALVMPSIGVMLFSILNLCGFKDLSVRSDQMVINLEKVQIQLTQENDRGKLNYSDFCRYARRISSLLLGETTDWYSLMTTKKISRV